MAVDYFLKIDDIKGESRDDKHKGEIEIQSFSWGLSRPSPTGPGLAGKVSVQDFHFVANTGVQSPPLLVATAAGQQFRKATLIARRSGEVQVEFLKVNLEGVLISSFQTGGSSADVVPTDQFSLNFTKIDMSVGAQQVDGSVTWVLGGYDALTGRTFTG